jgi:hypothetical protein
MVGMPAWSLHQRGVRPPFMYARMRATMRWCVSVVFFIIG